jgi:hypothetical protein
MMSCSFHPNRFAQLGQEHSDCPTWHLMQNWLELKEEVQRHVPMSKPLGPGIIGPVQGEGPVDLWSCDGLETHAVRLSTEDVAAIISLGKRQYSPPIQRGDSISIFKAKRITGPTRNECETTREYILSLMRGEEFERRNQELRIDPILLPLREAAFDTVDESLLDGLPRWQAASCCGVGCHAVR